MKESESWQKSLRESIVSVDSLSNQFGLNKTEIEGVTSQFQFRVPKYYLSLIKQKDDPIYKQCIPNVLELSNACGVEDPLGEDKTSPVPCIVHRYPDRCLFLVSNVCAMYCRFCTRKRKVSSDVSYNIEQGLEYIRNHPEIRDVIISGGDPFLLSDKKIEYILSELRKLEHIEILRIGTRTPCVLPNRITKKLCSILKKYHPLFINVHFNHPDELTEQSTKALGMLADAGIPLGSQTVLLKGVNDSPEVMKSLVKGLLKARVKPYYLYQADSVYGTEHFITSVETGTDIIKNIRGWTSGMAVPQFVIDLPDGGGKIPFLPDYVKEKDENQIVINNYRNKDYVYKRIGTQ